MYFFGDAQLNEVFGNVATSSGAPAQMHLPKLL